MHINKNIFQLIVVCAILFNSIILTATNLYYNITLLLLLLINIRLRNILNLNLKKFVLLSYFIDFIAIYYLTINFDVQNHLLLLITISDIINNEVNFKLPLSLLSISLYIFFIIPTPITIKIISIMTLLITLLLQNNNAKNISQINELQSLYDDIRHYNYQLEKAKDQIQQYSEEIEKITQNNERNRISLELHDSIGHQLTAILMQMESINIIFDKDKVKAKELIKSTINETRQAIDILRKTVKNIKPKENVNINTFLDKIINKFEKTNVTIKIITKGIPVKLSPKIELILKNNAIESITNSLRHGKATHIDIIMNYSDTFLDMTVKDNGTGCKRLKKGMGLSGIEDRLKILNGNIQIINNTSGFTIIHSIPLN